MKKIKLNDRNLGKITDNIMKSVKSDFTQQLEEKLKTTVNIDEGKVKFSFYDILTNDVMTHATKGKFKSLDDFFETINVYSPEDFEALPQDTLDNHVEKYTDYNTFQEFVQDNLF